MSEEPISMSFCISDSYAQHLAVVLTSVLANNPSSRFVFHVLHSGVTPENQARVKELEKWHPNCELRFHMVDMTAFADFPIPPGLEHVTRETYFRYLLPDILPDEPRTIYSDVDVLCVADIAKIWKMDLDGRLMAVGSLGDTASMVMRRTEMRGMSKPMRSVCTRRFPSEGRMRGWSVLT